jgi:hypothetical protein
VVAHRRKYFIHSKIVAYGEKYLNINSNLSAFFIKCLERSFVMYICPICRREYTTDEAVAKCFLRCWREEHPCQKSQPAPHSEDIFDRKVNEDISTFFNSFKKG